MVANQTDDAVTPMLKRLAGQSPATAAAMIERTPLVAQVLESFLH